jgi:hypothetical protein
MNIVNYMNHFWLNNQYEPCSPSETALYHYLLFEAERQQWTMPFRIPTPMVMTYTGISKQGIKDARESLKKRGFITYTKGEGKGRPALYSLVLNDTDEEYTQQYHRITSSQNATYSKTQEVVQDVTQRVPQEPIQELPQDLTHESTQNETQDLTQEQTPELSHEASQYKTPEPPQELPQRTPANSNQSMSQKLPLSKLRTILLNDKSWHDEMILQLANDGISIDHTALTRRIAGFLDWQEKLGVLERGEADCRSHILNSIRKGYLKKLPVQGQTSQLAGSNQKATDRGDLSGEEV